MTHEQRNAAWDAWHALEELDEDAAEMLFDLSQEWTPELVESFGDPELVLSIRALPRRRERVVWSSAE